MPLISCNPPLWFKFSPDEWLLGDISSENYCVQGLFLRICCYYWRMGGGVPAHKIKRRYSKSEYFNVLMDEYLKEKDGNIHIKFLDEQLIEWEKQVLKNSENGKKSAEKRKGVSTGVQGGLNQRSTDIDIDKEEDKEKEYISDTSSFSEKSGGKIRSDPRVGKALKKLHASGQIDLGEVEERFFKGGGKEAVIAEFQHWFSRIGYSYISDQGIATCFLAWEGQMLQDSIGRKWTRK